MLAACTALAVWLGGSAILTRRAPLQRPPDAFVERARQIADETGYGDAAADTAFGIGYNDAYLQSLEERDRSPDRWNARVCQCRAVLVPAEPAAAQTARVQHRSRSDGHAVRSRRWRPARS